ncbi:MULTISPECIES: hypothetical protein [unclassified Nocardioides]|uniref:hypothetical protein n=1 Tax=unclassified Nocardioides TaxID=2615069 RepID=UPI00070379AD|nr:MULTISPECIES: hypothetical protein [unclassified Nocardioides]KQP63618.1 hypothetical protein ASF47_16440 [Nocardioides sp. Leaf285]
MRAPDDLREHPLAPLVDHLSATTDLSRPEALRVAQDVVDFLAQPVEEVVRRRHAQLRSAGVRNADIFALVRDELAQRLVAAPRLTDRQMRRIVHG